MTKKTDRNTLVRTGLELRASKRLGRKIFLYSALVLLASVVIVLEINVSNTFVDDALTIIFMISALSSLIGVSLWAETPRSRYDDNLKNSDISISGSHRMTNIHNINNPANPLSYHHRNS